MDYQGATGATPAGRTSSPPMQARIAFHILAGLLIAAFAFLNWRFVLVHFSNGGYLLDSGWFAFLMWSADLALPNPQSIVDFSYYNMHIAPYLALFGMPLRAAGLDPFGILALHEGLMFGLLALALYLTVATAGRGWIALTLAAAALLIATGSNFIWRIASYPHFEIATVALCVGGAALLLAGRPRLAALPLALALTVREDAGFFVALYLAGTALLRMRSPLDWRTALRAPELPWAVAAGLVSVALFWIKGHFFFRYPTFQNTFSGHGWDHLSWPWLGVRLGGLVQDVKIDLTIAAVAVLGAISWRYLVYPALILPLVVAQLLAVQDGIGLFHSYYGIPWLVVWSGLLIVAAFRLRRGEADPAEAVAALVLAFGCSLAVPNFGNGWRDLWVPRNAITHPTVDLPALKRELEAAIGSDATGACLSIGAVALVPDAVRPKQVISHRRDLAHCGRVFLFRGDLGYRQLRDKLLAEGRRQGPTIGDRIETYF